MPLYRSQFGASTAKRPTPHTIDEKFGPLASPGSGLALAGRKSGLNSRSLSSSRRMLAVNAASRKRQNFQNIDAAYTGTDFQHGRCVHFGGRQIQVSLGQFRTVGHVGTPSCENKPADNEPIDVVDKSVRLDSCVSPDGLAKGDASSRIGKAVASFVDLHQLWLWCKSLSDEDRVYHAENQRCRNSPDGLSPADSLLRRKIPTPHDTLRPQKSQLSHRNTKIEIQFNRYHSPTARSFSENMVVLRRRKTSNTINFGKSAMCYARRNTVYGDGCCSLRLLQNGGNREEAGERHFSVDDVSSCTAYGPAIAVDDAERFPSKPVLSGSGQCITWRRCMKTLASKQQLPPPWMVNSRNQRLSFIEAIERSTVSMNCEMQGLVDF
ncbi:hypothetical protein CLF_112068 [Clonorchis sinensis]|uniref:Uncharacterized protein n=1 Tax=Clonorchis sinensis TaxID=79923 RepID=G7YVS7_CLOSI|nr:hypothetical protein CLF_112068 [Clonorchis sinensis]